MGFRHPLHKGIEGFKRRRFAVDPALIGCNLSLLGLFGLQNVGEGDPLSAHAVLCRDPTPIPLQRLRCNFQPVDLFDDLKLLDIFVQPEVLRNDDLLAWGQGERFLQPVDGDDPVACARQPGRIAEGRLTPEGRQRGPVVPAGVGSFHADVRPIGDPCIKSRLRTVVGPRRGTRDRYCR